MKFYAKKQRAPSQDASIACLLRHGHHPHLHRSRRIPGDASRPDFSNFAAPSSVITISQLGITAIIERDGVGAGIESIGNFAVITGTEGGKRRGFETAFVYLLKHNFDSGIGHLERTAGFFCRERGSFLRHGNRGDGESGNEHKGEDDERKDENGALAMGKRFDFYKHSILANIIALRKVYHKTKKALTHPLQI